MDGEAAAGQQGDLMVGQIDDLVGVPGQRRSVTAEEVFVAADSDH